MLLPESTSKSHHNSVLWLGTDSILQMRYREGENRPSQVANLVLKIRQHALAGVAQWTEHRPANQRVISSVPSQDTCLGWARSLGWGM